MWCWTKRGMSLGIWVVLLTMWISSYWRGAYVRHREVGTEIAAYYDGGRISLLYDDLVVANLGWQWGVISHNPEHWTIIERAASFSLLGFAFNWHPGYRGVVVPFWFVSLIATLQLLLLWRSKQTGKRQAGTCPICGYDLRAHTPNQKCSECGTQIPRFGWRPRRG
jgi:hypothetical protein